MGVKWRELNKDWAVLEVDDIVVHVQWDGKQQWRVRTHLPTRTRIIEATTIDAAKAEALRLVRERLLAVVKELEDGHA